jgi:hypothetical protein
MIGLLVHGNNHFIVAGPRPDAATARALARQWSIISIGTPPPGIPGWEMRTRAFREDLEWAVIVEAPEPHSAAVVQLLAELAARAVPIDRADPL